MSCSFAKTCLGSDSFLYLLRNQDSLYAGAKLAGGLGDSAGDLDTVQRQCDGQTALVHTLQAQEAALTARVADLEEYEACLTESFHQLQQQNITMDKEAAGLQQRLDTTAQQQHQVSIRPGLHLLHMWLAHTSESSKCLSARASAYLQACFGIWQSCRHSLLLILHGAITCHKVLPVCLSVCLFACVLPPIISWRHAPTLQNSLFYGLCSMFRCITMTKAVLVQDADTIQRLQMENEALRCKPADQEQRMCEQGEAVKGQEQQVVTWSSRWMACTAS